MLPEAPTRPLVLPVRDLRVMYGLNPRHYERITKHQAPHAHEFFVPMAALTAVDGDQNPAMQELGARMTMSAHFFEHTR